MSKEALYLIGVPGAGKSTLLAAALAGIPAQPMRAGLVRYLRYPGGVQLGAIRAAFSGTDALPMHVQPAACAWITATAPPVLVAEGDRLANDGFFTHLLDEGYRLTLAHLDCPALVASIRRSSRPRQADARWLAGRATKVERLAARWQAHRWSLDATHPLDALVAQLRTHPVLARLAGADTPHNSPVPCLQSARSAG